MKRGFWPVLALAVFLRLLGISWGLPHVYHQDEPILVHHALAVGERGWNFGFFVLPPFCTYLLFIFYGASYAAGKFLGLFAGKEGFLLLFMKDPTYFYVLGRILLGVLPGVATVAVLWKLGTDFFGKKTGQWAAFFLAANFLHAVHGHYLYVDITLTFFVSCFFYCLLRVFQQPSLKNHALAGIFFGVAVSVKYTAAYFLPGALLVYYFANGKGSFTAAGLRNLFTAAVAAFFVYAVIAPFTFLDWPEFLRQMQAQYSAQRTLSLSSPWQHHLVYSLENALGPLGFPLALAGVWAIFLERRRQNRLLAALAVTYYIVSLWGGQPFARYMMPLVPLFCLWMGGGWAAVSERLTRSLWRKVLLTVLVLLTLAPALYVDVLFLRRDTRDLCLDWVEQNVPENSVVVLDNLFYGPRVVPSSRQVQAKLAALRTDTGDTAKKKKWQAMLETVRQKKTYEVYMLSSGPASQKNTFISQGPFVGLDENELKEIGAKYFIVSYSDSSHNKTMSNFFKEHPGLLERMVSFNPHWDKNKKAARDLYSSTAAPDSLLDLFGRKRLGPTLEVYRIR